LYKEPKAVVAAFTGHRVRSTSGTLMI